MLVDSKFDSARGEVADETKKTLIEFAPEEFIVKLHRYHPFEQGIIVDDVTIVPVDPTNPDKRL